jgi:hypothetical protein
MSNNRPILEGVEGFDAVAKQMLGPQPAGIGKLGSIELQLAYFRFKTKQANQNNNPVPEQMLLPLTRNAGMFPPNSGVAIRMADELLKSLLHMTCLSPWWGIPETLELYNVLARQATLVSLQNLECFHTADPTLKWTANLKPGTKVLVISPFSKTIQQQVPKLAQIWPGLWAPDLIFKTISCPLSYGVQDPDTQHFMRVNWTDSLGLLQDLKTQMDNTDYDVVLVGAGIYSLPLVAHARQSNKRGIHLGGGTQLFFGIRGSRWDTMKEFQTFFNEHWVRPALEERPANFQMVERGCYW